MRARAPIILNLLLGTYVLSYLALSVGGAYAPSAFGVSTIKAYRWAPRGFYNSASHTWRVGPRLLYAPLYLADDYFIHNHHRPYGDDPTY
jgi:hypothetical protein